MVDKWNEAGRLWEADHGLLDDEQVAKCARADETEMFRSPVPTRMISNGEYMPAPQTEKQKQVESRMDELAESASKKLGVDRRRFLAGSGGMAASFLAMNEVFGRFFNVDLTEMFEPAAYAQAGPSRDLFVFDDQLHMVRGSQRAGGAGLRALAQGPSSAPAYKSNPYNPKGFPDEHGEVWGVWNPALVGLPITAANAQIVRFIKEVFLDSQVNIGLLSNVTASSVTIGAEQRRAPKNVEEALHGEILTAAQTAAVAEDDGDIALGGAGDVPRGEDVPFPINDNAAALVVADTQADRRGHDLLDELLDVVLDGLQVLHRFRDFH